MAVVATVPAPQEDPDLVCPSCKRLSSEERQALRAEAMTRIFQKAENEPVRQDTGLGHAAIAAPPAHRLRGGLV